MSSARLREPGRPTTARTVASASVQRALHADPPDRHPPIPRDGPFLTPVPGSHAAPMGDAVKEDTSMPTKLTTAPAPEAEA
ncbi:MAG: hypothetical protein M3345_06685, partial [Actinomycetota bacterium]|nr:hypothetical protein [Actinomycetota bacterium]